ncbi:MAG: preprotein translocase subunit SecG [Clostridiales bacterium]|nr:preprotein translocase subunit SecG [Clostridiales bacterium]
MNIFMNLLMAAGNGGYDTQKANTYYICAGILLGLIALTAIVLIILVLMQPANSSGIDALGGSSETFFGKNKGKSTEAKMKKWTWICLAFLALCSILLFVLRAIIKI